MTAPIIGQTVILKIASSPLRIVPAKVTNVIDEDTINCVGFADINDDWPGDGPATSNPGRPFFGVTRGTGVNQWQESDIPTDAEVASAITSATSGYATEVYVDNAQDNCMALPAGSAAGLTLGAAGVQLSTTRPCWLTVRGTASQALTLVGGQGYTVQLLCDSATTPTTVVDDETGSFTGTVVVGVAITDLDGWHLAAYVPAGHYVRVVQSAGAATVALTGSRKWVL